MLSMTNVGSVAAAASYYAEDNYYSKDENTEMSLWEGRGAEALGLAGPVNPEDFGRILSGDIKGQVLGRIIGTAPEGDLLRDHRPGMDITLSAPKSVSLLAEIGERADVRAAHEAAVSKVVSYMEAHLAQARVSEHGETRVIKTENLLIARFHHNTSRDLDPQTHTHLVIANATQLPDGRWLSLDNTQFYKSQHLLGSIYDSELAANLRELGYRLESGPEGRWEIAGISRSQIEHFSQRSQAIEERLEKFGLSRATASPGQREDAALRTRDTKREVDHMALRGDWQERAAAVGCDFSQIIRNQEAGAAPPTERSVTDHKAAASVQFAIAHLTERESVVERPDLIRTALQHTLKDTPWAGVRIGDVDYALDRKIGQQEALLTPSGQISTPGGLQRERFMLALLEAGRGAVSPITEARQVNLAVTRFEAQKAHDSGAAFNLTQGQVEAATVALTSSDRYLGLQGYAGVGKTTMMELVRTVAEEAGYAIRGMAPSAQAAMTLQNETGITSTTTAQFLKDESMRFAGSVEEKSLLARLYGAVEQWAGDLRSLLADAPVTQVKAVEVKELWIMDEASLSGQREMSQLMDMANRLGARLVLMGDQLQLNAVEAGKPFELLHKAGIDGATMSDIQRQQVDDLRNAVAAAVARDSAGAFEYLSSRITEISDRAALLRQVSADILAKHPTDRDKALIIVPMNEDRHVINLQVRNGLQLQGSIGADQLEQTVLIPAGFTDAQKQSSAYYDENMMVRFGRDYRGIGVSKGEYGKVIEVDRPGHQVTLQMTDGRTVQFSPAKTGKVEVYEIEQRQVGKGDELRFTRNDRGMGISNGMLAKVVSVQPDRLILSTSQGNLELSPQALKHSHWDYAYAMTIYASQGKTTNDVNFLITKNSSHAMGDRSFYVAITRPRYDMTIYTDDRSRAHHLIQAAQNKSSAVESINYRELFVGSTESTDGAKTSKAAPGAGRHNGAEL